MVALPAALQLLDDERARSMGHWSHWDSSSFLSGFESARHAAQYSSSFIDMQLNTRGTVDVLMAYHESHVRVSKAAAPSLWEPRPTEIPLSMTTSAGSSVEDMCRWVVYSKLLNTSKLLLPKVGFVRVIDG